MHRECTLISNISVFVVEHLRRRADQVDQLIVSIASVLNSKQGWVEAVNKHIDHATDLTNLSFADVFSSVMCLFFFLIAHHLSSAYCIKDTYPLLYLWNSISNYCKHIVTGMCKYFVQGDEGKLLFYLPPNVFFKV